MKARLLLANSAEVRNGLLFLLGGGWTEIGPQPQPFAIAGIVEVGWDETNTPHALEITIEDEDGQPLLVPTPSGDQPARVSSQFEAGRPPGVVRGRSFNVPLALALAPLPWTAGRRYVVKCVIDGAEADRLSFSVRAIPAPAPTR